MQHMSTLLNVQERRGNKLQSQKQRLDDDIRTSEHQTHHVVQQGSALMLENVLM